MNKEIFLKRKWAYLSSITLGLHLKHEMFYWRGVIIINIITAVIVSVFATNFIGYVKIVILRIAILTSCEVRSSILAYVFQDYTVLVAYLHNSLLKKSLLCCSALSLLFPLWLCFYLYTWQPYFWITVGIVQM